MDMSASIAPKSDQLDAIELVAGARTFTIKEVAKNNAEQPWNLHLAEFPRPWRPSKSMLRVMAAAWGLDGSKWVGNRVTLYCDPTVQFGGDLVGGTRISHMTGIDKPLKVPLLIKRGKSAMFTVQPLPDAPKQAANEIPAEVIANTKKAMTNGTTAEYLTWLTEQGAPQHILDYVQKETS